MPIYLAGLKSCPTRTTLVHRCSLLPIDQHRTLLLLYCWVIHCLSLPECVHVLTAHQRSHRLNLATHCNFFFQVTSMAALTNMV
ncbi:hypothetical protein XELAEV_18020529mg [Xenopus laevis]|uniref:Uncharacterized protein n=1 Tax=Xenopus laevis TaxID=8355 RepID=A0A974HQQ2_XENLA|nr:hypothetical protein XELAEV_18020529mg [Xenopus laevis]